MPFKIFVTTMRKLAEIRSLGWRTWAKKQDFRQAILTGPGNLSGRICLNWWAKVSFVSPDVAGSFLLNNLFLNFPLPSSFVGRETGNQITLLWAQACLTLTSCAHNGHDSVYKPPSPSLPPPWAFQWCPPHFYLFLQVASTSGVTSPAQPINCW